MKDKIKKEIDNIVIPKELSERSKLGVFQAKKEMQVGRKSLNLGIGVAVAVIVSACTFFIFNNGTLDNTIYNEGEVAVNDFTSVELPAIELPESSSNAKMIGLIVYNGKIYTQSMTEIEVEDAKAIMGDQIGKTEGNIDEWSKQDAYAVELASTIGETDVYSVNGYDTDFRIMTYEEYEGGYQYAQFFDSLNGITVNKGADIFGKLNMVGNVTSAQYRTFEDWNNGVDNFVPINDMDELNTFIGKLNNADPISRNENEEPLFESQNNEEYRELTVNLKDGSRVKLILLRDGYIYYGMMTDVYFKMNEEEFSKMWSLLK